MGNRSHGSGYRVEEPSPALVSEATYQRELRENAERQANTAAASGLAVPTAPAAERLQRAQETLEELVGAKQCSALLLKHPTIARQHAIRAAIAAVVQAAHDLGYEEGFADGQVQARESVGDWHDPRPAGA